MSNRASRLSRALERRSIGRGGLDDGILDAPGTMPTSGRPDAASAFGGEGDATDERGAVDRPGPRGPRPFPVFGYVVSDAVPLIELGLVPPVILALPRASMPAAVAAAAADRTAKAALGGGVTPAQWAAALADGTAHPVPAEDILPVVDPVAAKARDDIVIQGLVGDGQSTAADVAVGAGSDEAGSIAWGLLVEALVEEASVALAKPEVASCGIPAWSLRSEDVAQVEPALVVSASTEGPTSDRRPLRQVLAEKTGVPAGPRVPRSPLLALDLARRGEDRPLAPALPPTPGPSGTMSARMQPLPQRGVGDGPAAMGTGAERVSGQAKAAMVQMTALVPRYPMPVPVPMPPPLEPAPRGHAWLGFAIGLVLAVAVGVGLYVFLVGI